MDSTTHHPANKLSKLSDYASKDLQLSSKQAGTKEKRSDIEDSFPDYPLYPPSEDIYRNYTREEVDPEQPSRLKAPVILSELINQLDFRKELSADDLDVPGAELDDEQELIGSEDEENNYYSLGGDNHEDLDETKGEGI